MNVLFGWPLFLLGLVILLIGGHSLLTAFGYPVVSDFGMSIAINIGGPTSIRNLTTWFYGGVFIWLGFAMVFGSAAILGSSQKGEK